MEVFGLGKLVPFAITYTITKRWQRDKAWRNPLGQLGRVESFEWLHKGTAADPILYPLRALHLQALSCAFCAIQQMSAKETEQPFVGMMTNSAEVSDSTCSPLAAAMCDSQAHCSERGSCLVVRASHYVARCLPYSRCAKERLSTCRVAI